MKIFKAKEESVSDCMRRIYDSYLSTVHLITLLPSDPLYQKIKIYLIEKMRLTPNINNLDENLAYICSQEADDIARKSTQEKAGKNVFKVTDEEVVKDPTKKEVHCKMCEKKHARFACS